MTRVPPGSLSRRGLLAGAVGAAAAGAVGRARPARGRTATPVAATGRPNILFVLADDLDTRTFEQLDGLRRLTTAQGASFESFVVSNPLCAPSRASILRGQYPHNTEVLTNAGPTGGFPAFHAAGDEASTVAVWLRDAGYRTGLFGKYLNRYPKGVPATDVPPGWTDWHALVEGGADPFRQFGLSENGAVVAYDQPGTYLTDVLTAKADAFVRDAAAAGEPFFAYVAPYAPHLPATPAAAHAGEFADATLPAPPSFNEADVSDKPAWVRQQPLLTEAQITSLTELQRDRLRAMRSVEEMLATLLATLEETGQLDNTYVVFASDNGFHLGEHRLPMGKQTAYEESIRVPLVVRGPGVPAGATIPALAANIDLAPTFAAWAGTPLPGFVDGRSLAPLLAGETPADWRHAVLVENAPPIKAAGKGAKASATPAAPPPQAGGDADLAVAPPPPYDALRTDTRLYVEYATGERELYDLAADPYELQTLAQTAAPALLHALAAELAALRACAGEQCRAAENAAQPG